MVAVTPEKRGKAVENGVLRYTSASAMNRFAACQRSWWFRYVAGIPDPVGKAAQAGTEIHYRIQHYLTTGEDVLGPVERAALPLMPKPGPDLLVEQPVDGGLDAAGVPIVGGIDLLDLRGLVPVLTDWKTKGDPEAYQADQARLGYERGEWLADPDHDDGRQLFVYGEWFRRNRAAALGASDVVLRHVHIATRGRKRADELCRRVGLDTIEKGWQKIVGDIVVPMAAVAAAKGSDEVEPNTSHCYAYHKPCVYAARCGASTGKSLIAKWAGSGPKESTMSFLKNLQKMSATTVPVPAAPIGAKADEQIRRVETAPAPTAEPKKPLIQDESTIPDAELLAQRDASTPVKVLGVGATYKLGGGELGVFDSYQGPFVGRFRVGRGPVARWRDAKLETVGEEVAPPAEEFVAVPPGFGSVTTTPVEPAATTVEPASVSEAPKKRGRPKKAETAAPPDAAAELQAKIDEAVKLIDAENERMAKAPAAFPTEPSDLVPGLSEFVTVSPLGGVHLYFGGAYPVGVATKTLHAYVGGLEGKILGAASDVRLSTDERLTFGKWKAVLAGFAREIPLEPGHYLVTNGDERIEIVAEALAGQAAPGAVVRGGGR